MTNSPVPADGTVPALTAEDIALLEGATKTDDFKQTDLLIPFLTIVQTTSGYIIPSDADYVERARPGHIIDTLTKEPRTKVAFVPVKYATTYSEWKPNRGGLVKQWDTDSSLYDASGTGFGTRKTAEGNDIVRAASYYGLLINEDGSTSPVLLRMTGSQYKKSQRLNTMINMLETKRADGSTFTPPMYSRVYALETVGEKNDMGNWFGWKIEPGAMLLQVSGGKSIFQRADKLRQQLDAGTARAAPEPTAVASTTGRDGVDDVPF